MATDTLIYRSQKHMIAGNIMQYIANKPDHACHEAHKLLMNTTDEAENITKAYKICVENEFNPQNIQQKMLSLIEKMKQKEINHSPVEKKDDTIRFYAVIHNSQPSVEEWEKAIKSAINDPKLFTSFHFSQDPERAERYFNEKSIYRALLTLDLPKGLCIPFNNQHGKRWMISNRNHNKLTTAHIREIKVRQRSGIFGMNEHGRMVEKSTAHKIHEAQNPIHEQPTPPSKSN